MHQLCGYISLIVCRFNVILDHHVIKPKHFPWECSNLTKISPYLLLSNTGHRYRFSVDTLIILFQQIYSNIYGNLQRSTLTNDNFTTLFDKITQKTNSKNSTVTMIFTTNKLDTLFTNGPYISLNAYWIYRLALEGLDTVEEFLTSRQIN